MADFTAVRSMMFVPANLRRRWERAHTRGADVLIVDLEDGVGVHDKSEARTMVGDAVDFLVGEGARVVVRINAPWLMAIEDLKVAVRPGVSALMVPKVEDAGRLAALAQIVGEHEAERALPQGAIAFIVMIESPLALEHLGEIADAPRVAGLTLGTEDFSLNMGVAPTAEVLDHPARLIALVTKARGIAGFGVPTSIMGIDQPEVFGAAARRARAMGLNGGACADPRQVTEANAAFSPSAEEIAEAHALLAAWEAGGGQGVVRYGARILDIPVVLLAESTLAQARALGL